MGKIQSKFKELVKKYPDKNYGSKKFEDKLKIITLAYSQLKKTLEKMNTQQLLPKPDIKLSVKQTFGFDSDMKVGAFKKMSTSQK